MKILLFGYTGKLGNAIFLKLKKKNKFFLFSSKNANVKKSFFIDSFGYLLYFLNKLVFSKEVYPSKLKIFIWDKIFIPITYVIDFFSFYKFGKNIICIIQKNNTK